MKTGPIKTEKHYKSALQRIEELWGAPQGSPEGNELDRLVKLIENYERKHYPVSKTLRHVKSGRKFTRTR